MAGLGQVRRDSAGRRGGTCCREGGASPAPNVARRHAVSRSSLLGCRPQPSISGHDDSDWHLHIADDRGPVATEFATGAVMGLAMAFLELGPERFGNCADPRCGGVFLDASRNRSRRYCSDRCASRANVAAHRQRQRSGALASGAEAVEELEQ
jgi:hypothetical protein